MRPRCTCQRGPGASVSAASSERQLSSMATWPESSFKRILRAYRRYSSRARRSAPAMSLTCVRSRRSLTSSSLRLIVAVMLDFGGGASYLDNTRRPLRRKRKENDNIDRNYLQPFLPPRWPAALPHSCRRRACECSEPICSPGRDGKKIAPGKRSAARGNQYNKY